MPRKRKRNARLSVKKKSIKHTKKDQKDVYKHIKISILNIDDRSINSDNNNNDILISSSSNSSNCDISNLIGTFDTETATNIVSDDEDKHEEDAPIVVNDFMFEMKMPKQMKQESHRWSVFNLYGFKYKGLSPPDKLDLNQY